MGSDLTEMKPEIHERKWEIDFFVMSYDCRMVFEESNSVEAFDANGLQLCD